MKTCLGKKKTNSFADVLKGRRTVMTDFVSYATSRYCPDEEQTKLLAEFHKHVWKDCKIETVGQLTEYENLYLQYSGKSPLARMAVPI